MPGIPAQQPSAELAAARSHAAEAEAHRQQQLQASSAAAADARPLPVAPSWPPPPALATSTPACTPSISMLFVCAHLAAHQENVSKRNEDYTDIVENLKVGSRGPFAGDARRSYSGAAQRDATEEYDVVLFGGDLNYRINGTKSSIERIIGDHRHLRAVLVANDQLTIEKAKGNVFHHFDEGALKFRPTYKYAKDKATGLYTDEYDNGQKQRMAAFCDRVLYKKHLEYRWPVRLLHYSDIKDVRTSDHRPVAAVLSVATPPANRRQQRAGAFLYEEGEEDQDNKGCCSKCCCVVS
jgi:hypothetical protein